MSDYKYIYDGARFMNSEFTEIELVQLNEKNFQVYFYVGDQQCTDIIININNDSVQLVSKINSGYFFTLACCSNLGLIWKNRNGQIFVWTIFNSPRSLCPDLSLTSNCSGDIDSFLSRSSRSSSISSDRTFRSQSTSSSVSEHGGKQRMVKQVGALIDNELGEFFATEMEYIKGRNGKVGPPALRGEDTVFIPVKRMDALRNISPVIEELKSGRYTIKKVLSILQKKNTTQLKGYLLYFKLADSSEARRFLEFYYENSAITSTVPGVKIAVFDSDN